MKSITVQVKPEHFYRLDIPCGHEGTHQYSNPRDCPLFRALNAAGVKVNKGGIACDGIVVKGRSYNSPDNYLRGVEAIREKLLAGQTSVEVTFTEQEYDER